MQLMPKWMEMPAEGLPPQKPAGMPPFKQTGGQCAENSGAFAQMVTDLLFRPEGEPKPAAEPLDEAPFEQGSGRFAPLADLLQAGEDQSPATTSRAVSDPILRRPAKSLTSEDGTTGRVDEGSANPASREPRVVPARAPSDGVWSPSVSVQLPLLHRLQEPYGRGEDVRRPPPAEAFASGGCPSPGEALAAADEHPFAGEKRSVATDELLIAADSAPAQGAPLPAGAQSGPTPPGTSGWEDRPTQRKEAGDVPGSPSAQRVSEILPRAVSAGERPFPGPGFGAAGASAEHAPTDGRDSSITRSLPVQAAVSRDQVPDPLMANQEGQGVRARKSDRPGIVRQAPSEQEGKPFRPIPSRSAGESDSQHPTGDPPAWNRVLAGCGAAGDVDECLREPPGVRLDGAPRGEADAAGTYEEAERAGAADRGRPHLAPRSGEGKRYAAGLAQPLEEAVGEGDRGGAVLMQAHGNEAGRWSERFDRFWRGMAMTVQPEGRCQEMPGGAPLKGRSMPDQQQTFENFRPKASEAESGIQPFPKERADAGAYRAFNAGAATGWRTSPTAVEAPLVRPGQPGELTEENDPGRLAKGDDQRPFLPERPIAAGSPREIAANHLGFPRPGVPAAGGGFQKADSSEGNVKPDMAPDRAPTPYPGSWAIHPDSQPAWGRNENQTLDAPEILDDGHAPTRPAESELIRQIVRRMTLQSDGHRTQTLIKLKPEHLGSLRMQITTEDQKVTIRMTAETYQAKEIIERHLELLKTELHQHGLEIHKVDVTVSSDAGTLPDDERQLSLRQEHDQHQRQGRRPAGFDPPGRSAEEEVPVNARSDAGNSGEVDFFA